MYIGILDDDQSFLESFVSCLKQSCDAFIYPFSTEEAFLQHPLLYPTSFISTL